MANLDIPAGTYIIRPKDAPLGPIDTLSVPPHIQIVPPPDVSVNLGERYPWLLKHTNAGRITVHATIGDYRWIIKNEDSALYVSVSPERATAELIFQRDETNDEGYVFIDNPGIISSRLTYHKHATDGSEPRFTFQEANNSSSQLFKIEPIHYDVNTSKFSV